MTSSEVRQWYTVLDGGQREPELVDEDGAGVGTGDTVQTIKENLEVHCMFIQELFDQREIENSFEQSNVIGNRVNDGYFGSSESKLSSFGKVNLFDNRI